MQNKFFISSQVTKIFSIILMVSIMLLLISCGKESQQTSNEKNPFLCVGDYQTEEEAKVQLAKFANSYSTLEEWKKRAENIRQGILRGAELLNPPEKNPLNPIIHSKKELNGYTVENVAFESLPGFFVTGNLYKPIGEGPFAGILCPHGHWDKPEDLGRFRADMQYRCATFARMGAVVFAYDMIGWTEDANQCKHHHPKAVKLQTWNSIRALDFLMTLDEIDPERIGVTGASGGGTQTFLLAALDERIAVSIPTVMVSAHFFGGCVCESGMPIHRSKKHETSNVEIAALAAPRPMLLISDGDDWTKNTPEVEFPYIQNIYRLFGVESDVEYLYLPDEKHDYGISKRLGAYKFFAKHLGLSIENVTQKDGTIDENGVVLLENEKLRVFDADHPRPAYAVKGDDAVEGLFSK
jgi:uncharacterized protein